MSEHPLVLMMMMMITTIVIGVCVCLCLCHDDDNNNNNRKSLNARAFIRKSNPIYAWHVLIWIAYWPHLYILLLLRHTHIITRLAALAAVLAVVFVVVVVEKLLCASSEYHYHYTARDHHSIILTLWQWRDSEWEREREVQNFRIDSTIDNMTDHIAIGWLFDWFFFFFWLEKFQLTPEFVFEFFFWLLLTSLPSSSSSSSSLCEYLVSNDLGFLFFSINLALWSYANEDELFHCWFHLTIWHKQKNRK